MIQKLERQLENLSNNPPWTVRSRRRSKLQLDEGAGAPEPREYESWQNDIILLRTKIERAKAEEDARRQIDRP